MRDFLLRAVDLKRSGGTPSSLVDSPSQTRRDVWLPSKQTERMQLSVMKLIFNDHHNDPLDDLTWERVRKANSSCKRYKTFILRSVATSSTPCRKLPKQKQK